MPLENATTINQLDDQWPNGSDGVDRGDDHIRLLKHVLKSSFPGPTPGIGFSVPLTVDPVLLNDLANRLSTIEQSIINARPIGSLEFRADNINPQSLFPNTTWALITGDACVAFGNGSNGGAQSGNNTPVVPVPAHTHTATFTGVPLPPHNHYTNLYGGNGGGQPTNAATYNGYTTNILTSAETAGTPSGTVEIAEVGLANPTIDVRGARIYLNVWKRTA
jgi:hypothetical protein